MTSIYENESIIKVMHSYDNDLKWLIEDFGVYNFVNVVDTCKIHLMYNSYQNQILKTSHNLSKSMSLRELAEIFLGYEMSKDFQRADWRVRPLIP